MSTSRNRCDKRDEAFFDSTDSDCWFALKSPRLGLKQCHSWLTPILLRPQFRFGSFDTLTVKFPSSERRRG